MTVFTLPAHFKTTGFALRRDDNVQENRSASNKAVQRVDFAGEGWLLSMEFPPLFHDQFFEHSAFWNGVGKVHTFRTYHHAHKIPRGSMRGSPTLGAAYAEGVNTININSTSGATLLPGDFFSILLANGKRQLCEVRTSSTVGSVITVSLVMPIRGLTVAASSVIWDKPTADFRVLVPMTPSYRMVISEGYTIEAEEDE
jgi:hypothetical protein